MNPRNVRLGRAAAIPITGLPAVAELVHVEERLRTYFCL